MQDIIASLFQQDLEEKQNKKFKEYEIKKQVNYLPAFCDFSTYEIDERELKSNKYFFNSIVSYEIQSSSNTAALQDTYLTRSIKKFHEIGKKQKTINKDFYEIQNFKHQSKIIEPFFVFKDSLVFQSNIYGLAQKENSENFDCDTDDDEYMSSLQLMFNELRQATYYENQNKFNNKQI